MSITPEIARDMYEKRKRMLMSMRGDIRTALYDTLVSKIDSEYDKLCSLLQEASEKNERAMEQSSILPGEYFILKKLEVNLL